MVLVDVVVVLVAEKKAITLIIRKFYYKENSLVDVEVLELPDERRKKKKF